MAILERLFGSSRRPPARRGMEELLLGGGRTASGVSVSEERALTLAAVYACVRVLSETVAMLPLFLFERDGEGRRQAVEHPLYGILHDEPNPVMTATDFWETMTGHVCLWGNGFAEIERSRGGRPLALWPLRPDGMRDVKLRDGRLWYVYQLPNGRQVSMDGDSVLHLRGMGMDGIMGYSPVRLAREQMGMGLAVEEYGARFFRNGARPGGVLQHPGVLDDESFERLRADWASSYGGLGNSHRMAILEEGMSYQAIGVPPEEAQFLDSMKFNRTQIASIFRVPLHMIGDLERATFSNIEQQAIEFMVFSMAPWMVRFQRTINARLLSGAERRRYFSEFRPDALLRGDTLTRYQAYSMAIQNGWMSRNEVRRLENLNPFEGGDEYLVPLNMGEAGEEKDEGGGMGDEAGERGSGGGGGTDTDGHGQPGTRGEMRMLPNGVEVRAEQWDAALARQGLQLAYLPMYADVARRIARRESNDIGNAARRLLGRGRLDAFVEWLEGFWREHVVFVAGQYRPLVLSAALQAAAGAGKEMGQEPPEQESIENYVEAYTQAAAERYVGRRRAAVGNWLEGELEDKEQGSGGDGEPGEEESEGVDWGEVVDAFGEQLATWREEVPEQVAGEESVRVINALGLAFLALLGATRKTWITVGDSCEYCNALAGRTIGIEMFFLGRGESFFPTGAESPLVVGSNVGHAPAHRGCDCVVVAG